MAFDTLTTTVDGRIGRLTLDRPAKLNPLSTHCLDELAAAAAWFDDRPDVRVVIVSGAGRAFSAGADLSGFGDAGERSARDGADAGRVMVEAVERMRAVTIASIHGHCIGGGVLLAMACDLRVTAESTNFVIPEVDLGIPLTWGGIPRLVREIGAAATRDLVLSCRPFTAMEAHVRGIANRMVPDDDLDTEVATLAAALAEKSAYTLRVTLDAVDAAAEALVSTDGAWSDADQLATAMHDAESRAVAATYLEARGL
ncbi:MAG: putative enoyl-CoA hydratase echA8 [Acidimicrobiales bacterium]|nr:MAG: putative enoyl-CoA hydratase echA8 [Acidimicrobiales bacterium]